MTTRLPQYYSAAKKALAQCVRIDEVKNIRDKAAAMAMYAVQARDGQLASDATGIKMRATRRIGEIMEDDRKAGKLAKNAPGPGRGKKGAKAGVPKTPALLKQGVDKNLAKRARKAAKASEAAFEKQVAKAQRMATAAADGNTAVLKAAKAERFQERLASRAAREAALAAKIMALPKKRYGLIYADPEWKFKTFSVEGTRGSVPEDHYPTSELEAIKARNVQSIAADDCVLFLWATQPMLPQALEVMVAWGFTYKSHCIWNKDKIGNGYWFVNKHELLLVGTRGKVPAPAPGTQWPSVIDAPRGKHSEKPAIFYEVIEKYFSTLSKIELNARGARKGWDRWGAEAPEEMTEAAE